MSEEKKKVTKRLEDLLNKEMVRKIMKYNENISEIIPEVISWWGFDLYSRKPGPAYVDEDLRLHTTDLDLACFLYELSGRNAVINLPKYTGLRPKTVKEGQFITSAENRHGQLLGLSANKETFNFSIKIKDMNVVTTDTVGDYRNFSLTNLSGNWYDGWKSIEFLPTADENKFIQDNLLSAGNNISFSNFVHPNRWTSLFGQYYIITKILIDRLTSECEYYNKEIKEMLNEGIKYPASGEGSKDEWPHQEKDKGKSIKVDAFEVKIDYPKIDGNEFPKYLHNQQNLIMLTNLRKSYIYWTIPKLRFGTRATELSYYLKIKNGESYPGWVESEWKPGYVEPGKRTSWDRLEIAKYGSDCGAPLAILRRLYKKSEMVSESYEE